MAVSGSDEGAQQAPHVRWHDCDEAAPTVLAAVGPGHAAINRTFIPGLGLSWLQSAGVSGLSLVSDWTGLKLSCLGYLDTSIPAAMACSQLIHVPGSKCLLSFQTQGPLRPR